MKNLSIVILIVLMYSCTQNSDIKIQPSIFQWRGDSRDGKYNETGLLKSWPENGPEMLWFNDSVGNGYGSPLITSENIYIQGEVDSLGYLFAFDLKGKLLWKSEYGKEWTENFIGSRSTPTVIDNIISNIVLFLKENVTLKK